MLSQSLAWWRGCFGRIAFPKRLTLYAKPRELAGSNFESCQSEFIFFKFKEHSMTGVIENTNSKCLRLFFGLTLAFAIIVSSIGCSETAIPSANAVGNATTTPVSGGTPAEAVANSKPVSTGTTTTAVQEPANQDLSLIHI